MNRGLLWRVKHFAILPGSSNAEDLVILVFKEANDDNAKSLLDSTVEYLKEFILDKYVPVCVV